MTQPKTSQSNPLRVDSVAAPGGGLIGMTFCPGKKQPGGLEGNWDRDLALDLDRIKEWGAAAVVTLMEDHELVRFKVAGIGDAVRERGMAWHHLPIVDADVPRVPFETGWATHRATLAAHLAAGRRILLHCRGGLGRTGMVAARLLVELGVPAEQAISEVRAARHGAIETPAQEAHVRAVTSLATSDDVRDRARGALVGLAVGDALGTTLEFSPRDSYPHLTEMVGCGPFGLQPGQWTDDTSMALALADSLIAHPQLDPTDLMDRFVRWWREGENSCTGRCFDIGVTTRYALGRYERTGDPFAGETDEQTAGNGSLMRLSPVSLHCLHDAAEGRRIAAEQSRTTHAAPQAVEACIWFFDLLRRAILGEPKAALVAPGPWEGHAAMRAVVAGTWAGKPRAAISSDGYVIHTLEAALWAVAQTDDFESAVILAVNLGNDADTVGAVTGQLAGAIYGMSGIPDRWLAPLAWRAKFVGIADALLTRSAA
jgi:ADP-ribosyl-[dinitrogen reductase] hydrolase